MPHISRERHRLISASINFAVFEIPASVFSCVNSDQVVWSLHTVGPWTGALTLWNFQDLSQGLCLVTLFSRGLDSVEALDVTTPSGEVQGMLQSG